MWHTYTVEYYSAIRKYELLTTWMFLEITVLSEIRHGKSENHVIASYVGYKIKGTNEQDNLTNKAHRPRQHFIGYQM